MIERNEIKFMNFLFQNDIQFEQKLVELALGKYQTQFNENGTIAFLLLIDPKDIKCEIDKNEF